MADRSWNPFCATCNAPAPAVVVVGSSAYTVWAYYDGEHELPSVETLRAH